MDPALWAAIGATTAVLLVLLGVGLVLVLNGRRARGREQAALAAARADMETLRAQVEELSGELAATRGAASVVPASAEYVITTAGEAAPDGADLPTISDRAVLSVTLGEPLVKVAAFGYAVRRALSPQTRNRIAFEMRREVKRARKERRRAARRARVAALRSEDAA
ncbi:MAG TPA: hypothetical protein VLB29_06030 [Nocardioidaceae bacterium]|nr:hypothetical protein [Nocardioidaceae bacterium]